ncbi:hypothetical protein HRbin36_02107 [bacterium HR36]|nr:hypothetical protein HRbin36_02107 [bacterium HR36]
MLRKTTRLAALVVTLFGACVGWWLRWEIIAYYHAWCWHHAPRDSRQHHAERLAELGESAWPAIAWLLKQTQADRSDAAVNLLVSWWRHLHGSGRFATMLHGIARAWPGLTESGQACVLQSLVQFVNEPISTLTEAMASPKQQKPSQAAGNQDDGGVAQSAELANAIREWLLEVQPLPFISGRLPALQLTRWVALQLAQVVSEHPEPAASSAGWPHAHSDLANWWQWCRQLADLALLDGREEVRQEAVRLAALPQVALKARLARRLLEPPAEPSPAVRALLIIAVGDAASQDVAPSEELARFLHDVSEDVRASCEQVLRARGLTARQIQLARLWTHPDPLMRAQVPQLLYQETDLDPVPWLDRLSRDTSPLVRAAAVRTAAEHVEVRFAARLMELAEEDVSPTVRQLAAYYQREMLARQ